MSDQSTEAAGTAATIPSILQEHCRRRGESYEAAKARVQALARLDSQRCVRLDGEVSSVSSAAMVHGAMDLAARSMAEIAASSPARSTSSAPPGRPEDGQELDALKELLAGVRTREELKAVLIDLLFEEILAIAQGVIEGNKRRGRNTPTESGEADGGEGDSFEREAEAVDVQEQDF